MKQQENVINFDFTFNPKKNNVKSDLFKLAFRPNLIMAKMVFVAACISTSMFIVTHNTQPVSNSPVSSTSLNSIHELKIDSQKLVNTIFTLNKNSYKQNLYNLESNKILTNSGYDAILSILSQNKYIDKINNGYVLSVTTNSQEYPYLDKTSTKGNKETMEIVVPFLLNVNKDGINNKNEKKARLIFEKFNKQFLLIDMSLDQ